MAPAEIMFSVVVLGNLDTVLFAAPIRKDRILFVGLNALFICGFAALVGVWYLLMEKLLTSAKTSILTEDPIEEKRLAVAGTSIRYAIPLLGIVLVLTVPLQYIALLLMWHGAAFLLLLVNTFVANRRVSVCFYYQAKIKNSGAIDGCCWFDEELRTTPTNIGASARSLCRRRGSWLETHVFDWCIRHRGSFEARGDLKPRGYRARRLRALKAPRLRRYARALLVTGGAFAWLWILIDYAFGLAAYRRMLRAGYWTSRWTR